MEWIRDRRPPHDFTQDTAGLPAQDTVNDTARLRAGSWRKMGSGGEQNDATTLIPYCPSRQTGPIQLPVEEQSAITMPSYQKQNAIPLTRQLGLIPLLLASSALYIITPQ